MPLFIFALAAFAEDFWKVKPYTEWNEKEIKRMLTNSPWAREISEGMQGGGMPMGGGGGRGGRKGGGGAPSFDASESGNGGGGGGGMRGGDSGGGGAPSVTAKIRWQTALPIKQALLKQKFGVEAGSSRQAQDILKATDDIYLVVMEGLPMAMAQRAGQKLPEIVKHATTLKHGDKKPIAASDVRLGMVDKKIVAYIVFPRTEPIVLEDKDVEFISKLGPMEFKKKFKLADMVVDGKLSL